MSLESTAAEFLKQFEGFSSKAYYDVNAYRIGYGSDTIELPNGTHRKVVSNDTTTKDLATKDLQRRITTEFLPKVQSEIGLTFWNKLPELAQVALISLAYNYGSITKQPIIDSARTGDLNKLSTAIVDSTYNDNKNLSVSIQDTLHKRRQAEANLVKASKVAEETSSFFKQYWYLFAIGAVAITGIIFGVIKSTQQK